MDLELAVYNNLQETLMQLKDAGVTRAAFGTLVLEFSQPDPEVVSDIKLSAVAPEEPKPAGPAGHYAPLFQAGPPSFASLGLAK